MTNFLENTSRLPVDFIYLLFCPYKKLDILLKNIILGESPVNSSETYTGLKRNIKVLDLLRFKVLDKCCGGKIDQCCEKINILATYKNQPSEEQKILEKEIHADIISIRNSISLLNILNFILVIIIFLTLLTLIICFLDYVLSPPYKEKFREFIKTLII